MSSLPPEQAPGPHGLKQLFDQALDKYTSITGTNLVLDPLASTLRGSNSVDAVIKVYQDQFERFRHLGKKGKVIAALKPVVEVMLALSNVGGILGDALGSALPPAKAVLGGIGVLLQAAKEVSESYDALVGLFETISNFLERLKIYTDGAHGLASRMSAILIKITVHMLSVFALATQQIRQGRLKKYGKILLGQDAEIDEAVKTLDKLTAEEHKAVAALTLWTVHGLAVDMSEQRREEMYREIRKWLSPPDPSTNHNDTQDRHHEGTSTWLVNSKDFLEWKAQGSLLWISGKPGAGKTFLCSTVVEDLCNSPTDPDVWTIATAYFYCTFRDSEKQNIQGLLCSILHQLSARSDTYYLILSHLFSKKYSNGSRRPSNKDLVECLKEMLKSSDGTTYIVVDALDECPNSGTTSERRAILKLLEQLAVLKLPNLHLCVTSRPEDDIGSTLKPLASHHVTLEGSREQDEDIIRYIRSMIESHEKMRAWPVKIKEKVIETLLENADGMFRYASCQLDMLCDCDAANIETTLATLPKTLQETYEVTLERIEDGKWQSAHRLFQCLSFSTRPLRVEELAEVLAIDFRPDIPEYNEDWRVEDPEKAILSVCPGSFVAIVGEVDREDAKVVQFVHFSVKEFLVSYISSAQGNLRAVRFHVVPEPSHATLARACLATLFLIGDKSGEESVEEHPLAQYYYLSEPAFPLAEYAARYWVDHARFEDVSLSIMASLQHFFQTPGTYLSAWMRQVRDPHQTEVRFTFNDPPRPIRSLPLDAPLYCAALCGLRHVVKVMHTTNPEGTNEIGGWCGAPLHAASSGGHLETATLLLDLGVDVNKQGGYYGTALQAAAFRGSLDITQLLLDRGADVNAQAGEYGTALQAAASHQTPDIARLLLNHGANVNALGGYHGTALQAAAHYGSFNLMRLLLDRGADVNAHGGECGTALQAAAHTKSIVTTPLLLNRGADVNAQGGKYGTALHAAACGENLDTIQLLLDHGADVNAQAGEYGTALQAAVVHWSRSVIQLLLDRGADVNARGGKYGTALQAVAYAETPSDAWTYMQLLLDEDVDVDEYDGTDLLSAANGVNLRLTQLLLDRGADINAHDGEYGTALQAAVLKRSLSAMQLLLDRGADVNTQGGEYGTALQAAAYCGMLHIVQLLLNYDADVNAQGGEYGTALQAAASRGNLDIVQLLLDHGADVNAQVGEYGTALQAAAHGERRVDDDVLFVPEAWDRYSVMELLLDRGADVNAQCGMYCTALQATSASRQHGTARRVAQLLLDHGADPSIQGGKHGSALQAALSEGNTEIAQLLSSLTNTESMPVRR